MPAATQIPEQILRRIEGASPQIVEFLDLWNRARQGLLAPLRREFDPFEAPRLLRHNWLYRYLPEKQDFVCKLAGENVNEAWGGRLKGKYLSEVVGPDYAADAIRRWRRVIDTPLLLYGSIAGPPDDGSPRVAERLVLPLASSLDQIDHTIGISVYSVPQTDRDNIPPVWRDMVEIPCEDIRALDGVRAPDTA